MKIFVSAAEISSDLQAEKIIRALIALLPEGSVEIYGMGGPRLRALPGFKTLKKAEDLRAMGFVEVLSKLRVIRAVLNQVMEFLISNPPDLMITFDYPDFHFELLKRIHSNPIFKETLKVCGIPPKVWVWRSKRVEKIRKFYNGVWVIFPFEKVFYESLGIPVIYEGNPLIFDLLTSSQKYTKNHPEQINEAQISIAVMPGSREAELTYHLPTLALAIEAIAKKTGKKIHAQVPVPEGLSVPRVQNFLINTDRVHYEFLLNGSIAVLAQNSIGLIKSGTSTLEAAVLGCVPIIFYKANLVSEWIFRLVVKYGGPIGLPNILLGIRDRKDAAFPELLGPEATPESLSETFMGIWSDPKKLRELQMKGESLRNQLVPVADVSAAVAQKLFSWIKQAPPQSVQRSSKLWVQLVSFLWSALNGFRRMTLGTGKKISVPSVLVGNLQAGGAGKTPLVIALAKAAVARGYRVGVVSRGYGRKSSKPYLYSPSNPKPSLADLGDEPSEILKSVPEVSMGVGSDRILLSSILEKNGANFLIFDDGFQNLNFKASITVLAVTDATPSEVVFRDFRSAAQFADLVVQTKGLKTTPGLKAHFKIDWLAEELPNKPIWLLCAVADPSEVAQFYRNQGVKIEKVIALKDHSDLNAERVKNLMLLARSSGAVLSVTEKDKVKLEGEAFSALFVLRRRMLNDDWMEFIFERLHSSVQMR